MKRPPNKRYKVQLIHKFYYEVEVEAVSHAEAIQLAEMSDSADWQTVQPDHEIVEAWDSEELGLEGGSDMRTFFIEQRNLECVATYERPQGIWVFKAYGPNEFFFKHRYIDYTYEEAKSDFIEQLQEMFA